jgi:hypothetical protein
LQATNPGTFSIAFIQDIQESAEPFTVAVPFSEFRDRGGGTIPHDFSTSSTIGLGVFTSGLFDLDTYDPNFVERFTIGIDAIRIGAVPEPGTGVLWGSCLLGLGCLRRKWRCRKRGG